jgi:hypothetical protein
MKNSPFSRFLRLGGHFFDFTGLVGIKDLNLKHKVFNV